MSLSPAHSQSNRRTQQTHTWACTQHTPPFVVDFTDQHLCSKTLSLTVFTWFYYHMNQSFLYQIWCDMIRGRIFVEVQRPAQAELWLFGVFLTLKLTWRVCVVFRWRPAQSARCTGGRFVQMKQRKDSYCVLVVNLLQFNTLQPKSAQTIMFNEVKAGKSVNQSALKPKQQVCTEMPTQSVHLNALRLPLH